MRGFDVKKTAEAWFKQAVNIDKDYFYFTGFYATQKGTNPIEFQSLNFDVRFIESLENKYKSVVN